jgi:hypothetical protein
MSLTRKHLNQLADIVATFKSYKNLGTEEAAIVLSNIVQVFASKNCPNFDCLKWNDYINKAVKREIENTKKVHALIDNFKAA